MAGTRMYPFWILLELRVMEVVVTTGAIRCAKLQSNVTTDKPTPSFYRPDALQSTEGKTVTYVCSRIFHGKKCYFVYYSAVRQ